MAWNELADIADEAADDAAYLASTPPEACPNDGTPLTERDGRYVCLFDGWEWRGPGDSWR